MTDNSKSSLHNTIRIWRSTLAARYRSYNTNEERLDNTPEELTIGVWKELIAYFATEKFQKSSQTYSENRKKQKFKHTCGSKPFAHISYEMGPVEGGILELLLSSDPQG